MSRLIGTGEDTLGAGEGVPRSEMHIELNSNRGRRRGEKKEKDIMVFLSHLSTTRSRFAKGLSKRLQLYRKNYLWR